MENETRISNFDRILGALHGLPDVAQTKATTLRVVPSFGIGTHLYAVQTFRQKDAGDYVFLEHVADGGTVRLVIPPSVVDAIVRQRDSLTTKVRSRIGKIQAEDRKRRGIKPGFMQKR